MTGREPPEPPERDVPGALPEEPDEHVRRLLADAAGPAATPPDVVARLDETLAGLVAARSAEAAPGPAGPVGAGPAAGPPAQVTDLAARRRSRRWPGLVAAAASVVALGYGVTVVAQNGGGGGDDAGAGMAADSAASEGAPDADEEARPPGEGAGSAARAEGAVPGAPDVTALFASGRAGPAAGRGLAGDLRPWTVTGGGGLALPDLAAASVRPPGPGAAAVPVCRLPETVAGERGYLVSYRGGDATLVLGPVTRGRRVAVVYSCGSARPLAATVVDVG